MKIFFTNETKKLDRFTIENEPISSIDLMERAASAVTFEIISRWKRNTPIVVFAGPGNNGGDALAVSRMLIEEGYTLNIFLFNPLQKLSQDCLKNRDRLQATDGVRFIKSIKNTNYQTNTNYNLSQNCSVFHGSSKRIYSSYIDKRGIGYRRLVRIGSQQTAFRRFRISSPIYQFIGCNSRIYRSAVRTFRRR